MENWFIAAKRADFARIAEEFHISPVTARLIRNRDIVGTEAIREYLCGTTEDLSDPRQMKDCVRAAKILEEKIASGRRIRIVGDYDIDGVCASYILLKGLQRLGAAADVEIPDRVRDGYGVNAAIVRQAAADGIDTVLTCDNGISAVAEIALAKELGLCVVVTDHHDIPYEEGNGGGRRYIRSAADAVVNPKQEDCPYPFKQLCGAAVAYRLVQVLYERRFDGGFALAEQEFLPFAAIATVGDIMELKGENRILVKQGLKMLAFTEHPGLLALMEACGVNPAEVTSYHIGFVLGPCINASGRLDTAKRSLRLLTTADKGEAARLAAELKALNDERKERTAEGVSEAVSLIEREGLHRDKVMVVPLYDCHESLAGIIAGRIRERYHRPVFVLTRAEAGGVKGSGRSIEAFSMYEELVKCREHLERFGGHPMAAGLSMREEEVEPFRRHLNANAALAEADFIPKVSIDVAMPLEYISEAQIRELSLLEPFGKGNEKPQFAQKDLKVRSARVLGKNRNVLKLLVESPAGGAQMDALYFGDIPEFDVYIRGKFGENEAEKLYLGRENAVTLSVVYYPDVNEYRGVKNLQIVIKNYR